MFVDLPLEQLQQYLPPVETPADFDAFWEMTLAESRQFSLAAQFTAVNSALKLVEILDATFCGFGGQPVKGWLVLPRQRSGRLPCVVQYLGYGGGRGLPGDYLYWANAGFAHFIMDTRGQGSAWSAGDTPDLDVSGGSPQMPGFLTRGITNPYHYYYRRLYTDAVRAVEAARTHPAVDPERVAVFGHSQGGALSVVAAGLIPDLLAVMPREPFLCDIRTATEITDANPYQELTRYCAVHRDQVEQVFANLRYFDGVSFAARAKAPALFSVSLMDDICPPRTVFAAYNRYAAAKEIRVWKYNRHEGGENFMAAEQLDWLSQRIS